MKQSLFALVSKYLPHRKLSPKDRWIANALAQAAAKTEDDIYKDLGTSGSGLSEHEVVRRRSEYGLNVIVDRKRKPWYIQFLLAFKNPFNFVLLILIFVSWVTEDYTAVGIIAAMILISVFIKFFEEYRSGRGAESLRKMVHVTCTVQRSGDDGKPIQMMVPLEELVAGDVIHLGAGDIVPADVRLVRAKNLFISQSALTGESMSVEKYAGAVSPDPKADALALTNICFMGTSVDSGTATAVVLATGTRTYFGAMAESLIDKIPRSSFDKGVNDVSWLLIKFMATMVPVVFFITGFTKGDWLDAMLFALSVAVGLTPEMLPVVVTSNLAKGAIRMAREKVIVKKLGAIQDFGAMNVLCTDKTGTLTEDRIVLMKYTDAFLNPNLNALRYAYLNSYFETGLKNLMDQAILDNGFLPDKDKLAKEWRELDELPFDFERRRMSVVLARDDKKLLVCKGAVDEMLTCCATVDTPDGQKPLTDDLRKTITANVSRLSADGLRVIAVGHRFFSGTHSDTYTTGDESDLMLDGFMSFLDPPKESAKTALEALAANGIRVMVLTGDNDAVTRKVCSEVGLSDDRIILGSDLEPLSDSDAYALISEHRIFAKLAPMQKARIVTLLRGAGNVVGYLGDGINDAVSLRDADIGISVDTAVDIAKESADIILLQKSLMALNKGVVEGRKMFANTMKYIKITAGSNFGNVLTLLGASVLFPFLPMLPLQILILNLMYDISQIAVPWDNVDPEYLSKPRKWEAAGIKRFMFTIGPVSSVFDYATFAVLWYVVGADTVAAQGVFQTGWFIESLFTQTLIFQILRTEKVPFFKSSASWQLTLSGVGLLALGVMLPYTGLGHEIGFSPLPAIFYYWLLAILIGYCLFNQYVKRWYIKRYGDWI